MTTKWVQESEDRYRSRQYYRDCLEGNFRDALALLMLTRRTGWLPPGADPARLVGFAQEALREMSDQLSEAEAEVWELALARAAGSMIKAA